MRSSWALAGITSCLLGGCATLATEREARHAATDAAHRDAELVRTALADDSPAEAAMAAPTLPPPESSTPGQPVEAYVRQALAANPTVRAAHLNVMALQHRIPQVTALDDPVISNTIFPIPSIAPQYSLMGYMPYQLLLAQQFPWCGTLRVRGQAAERDVEVALFELAAVQLDVVAAVKRSYADLAYYQRAEALLAENRAVAEDFLTVARERYKAGNATQVDILRADVSLSDIDRELENNRQGRIEAEAELARQLHMSPDDPAPRAAPELPLADLPARLDQLQALANVARPELRGRQAAIARDERAIELARKRGYPNVTLGVVYQDMEKTNAMTPKTAAGMPNVGLFVGFNLPVYRSRVRAGVAEAEARAAADAALLDAERDQARRDVKDLFSQANTQHNVLGLLRRSNLPAARQALELTAGDYRAGNVDSLALLAAWRDRLQVELQIAQLEAELFKTMASLERAVGSAVNENPPPPPDAE